MPRRAAEASSRLHTKRDIEERCRVSKRTVERWIKRGILDAINLGGPHGPVRITEDAFLNFLSAGSKKRNPQKSSH